MKFKIDENLPIEIAALFEKHGHDATTVFQEQLVGAPDSRIATVCRSENRTLVTLDTDFCDIRTYPPKDFEGIIVLRLESQDKPNVLSVVNQLFSILSNEPVSGHLWVVEENRVRIRG